MSLPVLFDTNTTFGFPGSRIDSGLALFYLLGREDVEIKGITITGTNDSLKKSVEAVSWILRLNNRSDIPIIPGCINPGDYGSPASDFLAETAGKLMDDLTVITTGPLGNVYGASIADHGFYSHVKQIIACGGLLHPLQVPDWKLYGDISFSLDPFSAEDVLNQAPRLVLMNMHVGTQAVMNIDELFVIKEYNPRLYHLVKEYLLSDTCGKTTRKATAFLWSMLPVIYLGNSNLFHNESCRIRPERESLERGIIRVSETGNSVTMPDYITDIDEFYRKMHRGWEKSPFRKWPDFRATKDAGK